LSINRNCWHVISYIFIHFTEVWFYLAYLIQVHMIPCCDWSHKKLGDTFRELIIFLLYMSHNSYPIVYINMDFNINAIQSKLKVKSSFRVYIFSLEVVFNGCGGRWELFSFLFTGFFFCLCSMWRIKNIYLLLVLWICKL